MGRSLRSILAVARYTFTQCLRMKIGGLFIVLLAVMLGALPLALWREGTPLADQIRTFLSYSSALTAMLLIVVTVFLGAGVISFDVRDKQLFTVASKPLARWQYIVGRWLGLVALNVALLAISAGVIYGVAQHMRGGKALNLADRRAVETEVLTARRQLSPKPIAAIEEDTLNRLGEMNRDGRLQRAVEFFLPRAGGDEQLALEMVAAEIRKQISEKLQSAAVGESLQWRFSDIRATGQTRRGQGLVHARYDDRTLMSVKASEALVGHLIFGGPVTINGVEARVLDLGQDVFHVQFTMDNAVRSEIAGLSEGKKVQVAIEPLIQLRFQASVEERPPGNTLRSGWLLDNGAGYLATTVSNDPPDVPATVTFPAKAVGPDGSVTVRYTNLPDASGFHTRVTIRAEDVAVLYRVGAFEWNFVRGMLQILIQLMFIAALAVLAGSFLAFPVASLMSFVLLAFGLMRQGLAESIKHVTHPLLVAASWIVKAMFVLLPDLENMLPGSRFVAGQHIAWGSLGIAALDTLAVRMLIVLALACLIFRRRELARVQV